MMSDVIDDALDDDEAEEETEELTNQVNFRLPFIAIFFEKKICCSAMFTGHFYLINFLNN
jgi:hypothetical protein